MAKLANYGDLPSGFTQFLAFGEDKDRFEVPVQRKRSLEALARFGGKALDDASLPVHCQLRQLLVREVLPATLRKSIRPQSGSEHLAHRG